MTSHDACPCLENPPRDIDRAQRFYEALLDIESSPARSGPPRAAPGIAEASDALAHGSDRPHGRGA